MERGLCMNNVDFKKTNSQSLEVIKMLSKYLNDEVAREELWKLI